MENYFKKLIKYFFSKTSWRLKKIHIRKNYVNQKPNLSVIKALYNSSGVIHMGAHRGGESPIYDWFQKKTIWIEANPKLISDLRDNIYQYPYQKVIHALLSDKDDEYKEFYVSNNDSASSSVFEFGQKSIDQNLKMISKMKIKSSKFDTIVKNQAIEILDYNFWVIDLQGSELLALKGAKKSLEKCKSILVEISKTEYYKNAVKWEELKKFLNENNFFQEWEPLEDHTDVLFIKNN